MRERVTVVTLSVCQSVCLSLFYFGEGAVFRVETSLVPRSFYARGARWERDKGLVPVIRACVEFYWNPGKIVFFGIF